MSGTVLAYPVKDRDQNVIPFKIVGDKPIKRNKDGSVCKIKNNRIAGVSTEVFFLSTAEKMAMEEVFRLRIRSLPSTSSARLKIARRNLLLFNMGIQAGLRASDLCVLKWSFFFEEKDFYENKSLIYKPYGQLMPKKTRKHKKFATIYFSNNLKKSIQEYIDIYPITNLEDYIFTSQKGGNPIEPQYIWDIVDKAAYDAGVNHNVGSHSLRKTFGYHVWHNAEDKNKALVVLQEVYNHSSSAITRRYIGITHEEKREVFDIIGDVFDECKV